MASRGKEALGLAAVLGAAAAGWAMLGDGAESSRILVGRIWLDRLPSKETDHAEAFVVITAEPVGLFQRASKWEGGWTMFRHELRGDDRILLMFPQDKSKHEVVYKAWECKEKSFDYCLELEGAPRGAKKYVSRKEWELEGADAAALAAGLEAFRGSLAAD